MAFGISFLTSLINNPTVGWWAIACPVDMVIAWSSWKQPEWVTIIFYFLLIHGGVSTLYYGRLRTEKVGIRSQFV